MEEKVLTEKESLALITGMITKAKNHYHESGSSALLWGFANVICFAWVIPCFILRKNYYKIAGI